MGNAYFIGFGNTKRVVLFDTLIAGSTPDEIEAVVAHELGHYRHGHVLFGLLRGAVIAFVVLAAFGWLTRQGLAAAVIRHRVPRQRAGLAGLPVVERDGWAAGRADRQLDLSPE